jgi:DNA-binding protein HU-beta
VATVTKADLLDRVASSAGVSKTQAESVLDAFFDTVKSSAKKGDKVGWPGFGNFSTTKRAARTGRNPRTGASVKIPASTAMKFSASSTLKDFFKGGAAKAAGKKAGAKKTTAKKAAKRR